MFKDKLLLAGIAGLIGVVADIIVEYLFFWLRISDTTTAYFIANIIFSKPNLNAAQLMVGLIAHLIAGAVVGLIPFMLYLWSGKKYPLIKGAAIGAGFWLSHVVLVPSFVGERIHLAPPSIPALLVEFMGLILWGMITYGIIAKFGDKVEAVI